MRRISMLNNLAFLKIPTMSTAAEVSGAESLGESGNEGTNGFGDAAGVFGAGWGGLRGEEAGDNWAKVVVECKNETSSASVKDRIHCFLIILVLLSEGLDDIGKDCK